MAHILKPMAERHDRFFSEQLKSAECFSNKRRVDAHTLKELPELETLTCGLAKWHQTHLLQVRKNARATTNNNKLKNGKQKPSHMGFSVGTVTLTPVLPPPIWYQMRPLRKRPQNPSKPLQDNNSFLNQEEELKATQGRNSQDKHQEELFSPSDQAQILSPSQSGQTQANTQLGNSIFYNELSSLAQTNQNASFPTTTVKKKKFPMQSPLRQTVTAKWKHATENNSTFKPKKPKLESPLQPHLNQLSLHRKNIFDGLSQGSMLQRDPNSPNINAGDEDDCDDTEIPVEIDNEASCDSVPRTESNLKASSSRTIPNQHSPNQKTPISSLSSPISHNTSAGLQTKAFPNTYGFRLETQHVSNETMEQQHQKLTMMSLELITDSRQQKLSNPVYDAILAIVCVLHSEEKPLMSSVEKVVFTHCETETSCRKRGLHDCQFHCTLDEMNTIQSFIDSIQR
eukprot:m.11999 g.11999  ORF g.11999 m.11999 type:complete len:455 (+) comp7100_c1_seq2:2066-3430(+)